MRRYEVIVTPFAAANIREAHAQLLEGGGTPWKVFFTVHQSAVHVLDVRHGARDFWRP